MGENPSRIQSTISRFFGSSPEPAPAAAAPRTISERGPASPPAPAKLEEPAAAGPVRADDIGPDVWHRGDRYAHGVLTAVAAEISPATSGPAAAMIPVKPHLRAAPGTAGAKAEVAVTLDVIVGEFSTAQRKSTVRAIQLGRLCDVWIRQQSERPADAKLDRPSAITAIAKRLADAKIDRPAVGRLIRCYWVARLFGGKAEEISFSALRELQPLIERDRQTEEWRIVPAHAAAARSLWARALLEHISADAVRLLVRQILPPKSLKIRKKIRLVVLLRQIAAMSRDERIAWIRRCEEENARSSQPSAA